MAYAAATPSVTRLFAVEIAALLCASAKGRSDERWRTQHVYCHVSGERNGGDMHERWFSRAHSGYGRAAAKTRRLAKRPHMVGNTRMFTACI